MRSDDRSHRQHRAVGLGARSDGDEPAVVGLLMPPIGSPSSMNELVVGWLSYQVPVANGVVRPDGRVHRIRPRDSRCGLPQPLSSEGECDLRSLADLVWTSASPYPPVTDAQTGLVCVVGEGGMGADGFVALQSGADRETLLWLAFFDFSNPFESVRFEAGMLKARNNMDEEWHFDIAEPWKIVVHAAR